MADGNALEALQALHRELVAIGEHRLEGLVLLEQCLEFHADSFQKLLDKAPRKKESRDAVESGKIKIVDEEYSINKDFQGLTLQLADEIDLDEIEAAKLLLESEDDQIALGRPLLECGLIRFHQQRKYLLDCMRLCISAAEDDVLGDLAPDLQTVLGDYILKNIFLAPPPGQQRTTAQATFAPRCMTAMLELESLLQKLADRVTAASVVYASTMGRPPEFQEMIDFSRLSLIQQHESLAVMLCTAIEKRHATARDFQEFLKRLKRADRYDHLLVHLFPVVGVYIRVFGSPEGVGDLAQARELNALVCKRSEENAWQLSFLRATIVAWWIAEYSGWYADDQAGADDPNIEQEDQQRARQFTYSLKEGAFDFMLALATDVKSADWQGPTRTGIQQWLQRKSPVLNAEPTPFSDFFQIRVMEQLEFFIDAFISNLPDVLRRLRIEEDEQRQLSQTHEQDLDLERFLLIISYSYGGRPDAADAFWSDPDSNLAGFIQWASRRASTPLVSAFCEMLQSISDNESCANAAHLFLLDEGLASSGKMRKAQSLSWNQIFKELEFFTNKIRDRANAPQSQTYRAGKPSTEQSETEPESAMMLECYLKLISKLASNSAEARHWLLHSVEFSLVPVLYQLASLPVPGRLRVGVFFALKALLTGKSQDDSHVMWNCFESFMAGYFVQTVAPSHRGTATAGTPGAMGHMGNLLDEIGRGFEQPNAFIQFLISLMAPVNPASALHDSLPFPENVGSSVRTPGVEPYVDFVLGTVFAKNSTELSDTQQLRILRLSCLEYALICLETFNEDLIIIGNETNIAVDSVIGTTDLATYVRLHPFARTMEWMLDGRVVDSIFNTIHQDSAEIGAALPDSPLILGMIRGVEVVLKVLELQNTYLDLVRQFVRLQPGQRQAPVGHSAYSSFDEGIMDHLDLIVDLGRCCSLGHPALTLGCLKLLEKISTSPRIITAWNPSPGRQSNRNKAIVALEKNNAAEAIAGSFVSELTTPLDMAREADSPNFMIKIYILDFLYACLQASPSQPSIAHLLLGFQCGINTLTVAAGDSFESRTSLFHNLLRVQLEAPFGDDTLGVRHWLVMLKYKTMRVFQALWSSPLSSGIVLKDLRENEFLFHLLLREVVLQPQLPWDGEAMGSPNFLQFDGAMGFVEFLALRAMTLEYLGIELCSVSQKRLPNLKRRIFDALSGRVVGDANEAIEAPTAFDLYDFLSAEGQWSHTPPQFEYFKDIELRTCVANDLTSTPMYNIDRVREILLLKRAEGGQSGRLLTKEQEAAIKEEEASLLGYLTLDNRKRQLDSNRLDVLKSWVNLLLVMFESNDFDGTAKTSFLLQALQAILPSLEGYGSESPNEAFELAKLAKVLLFTLDLRPSGSADDEGRAMGNLVSDKLFQLFQICLYAIGKWAGNPDLRAIYYNICYRYVTGIVDKDQDFLPGRQKTIKSIQVHGERLLNVVCDDAHSSDASSQTAALILLGGFVKLSLHEHDTHIVENLNRLNFIGVLVDSLKTIMQENLEIIQSGNLDQQQCQNAKLALVLQLCQTRDGAKYVLHANLFRAIELSGLFSADPELQLDPTNSAALAQHYALLAQITRIIGAAILSRGSHNVLQGSRFLTDHRMLVMHVLKRSAGIGAATASRVLDREIYQLAEAFMVLIIASKFIEFEDKTPVQQSKSSALFH